MPYRIYPGGLSVSRSFGDAYAKIERLGGKKGVLIATPEVTLYEINSKTDYLFLGCDGIFDIFKTTKLNLKFWEVIKQSRLKGEDLVRELVD